MKQMDANEIIKLYQKVKNQPRLKYILKASWTVLILVKKPNHLSPVIQEFFLESGNKLRRL